MSANYYGKSEEIHDLLMENLPSDNSQDTDVEDEDEDVQFLGVQKNNFDRIFEEGLDGLENTEDDVESQPILEVIPESEAINGHAPRQEKGNRTIEPDRKWKKKEVSYEIPIYDDSNANLVVDFFNGCTTASDIFMALLGESVKNMTFQTNLYATQKNKNLKLREEELLGFIGINFVMGYNKLPSIPCYWSTSKDLGVTAIMETMTRNRFQEILSHLHVNDNANLLPSNTDKIYKIRPLVDSLNNTFSSVYVGSRQLAVDESMILFKGRSSLKQYNPQKPIKRGYKLWCLADKKGYIKKFQIYQGKDSETEEKFKNYGLGERVVLSLTESEWNKNKIIYFDNYFTSIPLLEKLKIENTLACGTIRPNRKGIPKNLVFDKKMKRGDFDYRVSSMGITYFKWRDNKVVTLASNFHSTPELTSVDRREKDGSKVSVPCPGVVKDYNEHMGGVDNADRLRGTYGVDRKSKKWWHRLFWGLLDIAFVNSYIIYCEKFENIKMFEFRRSVAMGLMTKGNKMSLQRISASEGAPSISGSPRPLIKRFSNSNSPLPSKKRRFNFSVSNDVRLSNRGVHWITFVSNRGRCEYCSMNNVQSKPHSKCVTCGVFLCRNEKKNCFAHYHEVK